MATFFGPAEHIEAPRCGEESRLWSCGQPCMLTGVDIFDEGGRSTAPIEVGEIVLRGNLISPFYYRDANATAEVRRNGWHHTGDLGYRDRALPRNANGKVLKRQIRDQFWFASASGLTATCSWPTKPIFGRAGVPATRRSDGPGSPEIIISIVLILYHTLIY